MIPWHTLNLALHIGFGGAAVALGTYMLVRRADDDEHAYLGRWFLLCIAALVLTAALSLAVFRDMPQFVLLSVLACYPLLSGCRSAWAKEGPQFVDALLAAVAVAMIVLVLPDLWSAGTDDAWLPAPVLGLIAVLPVLAYDSVRWLLPRPWFGRGWRYEHICKLVVGLSALSGALASSMPTGGSPTAQLLLALGGMSLAAILCVRAFRREHSS